MTDKLQFLKTVKPFDLLPVDVLEGISDLLEEVVYKKETTIYLQDQTSMAGLDIILEGQYEAFFYDTAQNKRLPEVFQKGTCYGGISILLNKKKSIRTVVAKKGAVIYRLPKKDFKALCQAFDEFFQYFTDEYGKRMLNDEYAHFVRKPSTNVEENYIASDLFYSRKLETIVPRDIVYCLPETPIFEAARLMSENKTSCLIVKDHEEKIVGFITDITLRDNVTAKLVDSRERVFTIMDNPVVSISNEAYVYEAILLMFQTKTRYLLVEENGEYKGLISRNKLLTDQAQSPFVFIQSVKLATSMDELKLKWQKVPEIVFQLLTRGVRSEIVNQVITSVSDAILQKVIEGAIEESGPPPAKFVFMVLGSEGRKEQTLKTDQDNAIIYEDKANEQRELVREYFLKFASMISERLDQIGFSFCEGGFMAKNPKWTHSLSHWKRNYDAWMNQSSPETVMNFATFFDCRYIYGDYAIMEELQQYLGEKLQKPYERFLYHMANNALQYEPPLTFFKTIRTFTKGEQKVFNIKKTMAPIVDLVRVYALKNRIFRTNTGKRLEALLEKGVFSYKEYHELIQAYYYLMGMRLKKQARQIIVDHSDPENFVDVNSLTKIEVVTLIEIFKVIENFQTKIRLVFTKTLFA